MSKNQSSALDDTLDVALDAAQFEQLRTAALQLKTQLETQDPEKFEEVSFAAQHAVETLGITYEEAIIQVLMGAIVESLDEF